jgi:hypothetical protein
MPFVELFLRVRVIMTLQLCTILFYLTYCNLCCRLIPFVFFLDAEIFTSVNTMDGVLQGVLSMQPAALLHGRVGMVAWSCIFAHGCWHSS